MGWCSGTTINNCYKFGNIYFKYAHKSANVGSESQTVTGGPQGRRQQSWQSLGRGPNITHVDRETVNKCVVIYLLLSGDVMISGQHCIAGPT